MAKRKRYTDKFRADAVVMLEHSGYPDQTGALTRVSDHLGVPKSTLSRWFKGTSNPPPSNIVTEKRFDLIQSIRDELQAIFGELPEARPEAGYKDLTTSAAILIDKLQLLGGQPTAIIKLQRAIADGKVKPEDVRERWPTLAEQLFESVGADVSLPD